MPARALLPVLALAAILALSVSASADSISARPVALLFAPDVSFRVRRFALQLFGATATPARTVGSLAELRGDEALLSVGETPATRALFSSQELSALRGDAFAVKSGFLPDGTPALAAVGRTTHALPRLAQCNIAQLYGMFAALERLGFAFLHPLAPTAPGVATWPSAVSLREAASWPVRSVHLHTQHPIELAHVLNGWGPSDRSEAGFRGELSQVDSWLAWAVANRQNRVQWALLGADAWRDFADGAERQRRLREVASMAHDWCLAVGVDAPIAFRQQHAWTLVRSASAELPVQIAEIRAHIDWLAECEFDFLSTESGLTEFSHPEDKRMLAWMNETALYAAERHAMPTHIKVHCSSGQKCKNYRTRDGSAPLDFNFLPTYAVPQMGVLPHTVQPYGVFDDPTPVYGNSNFSHIATFMFEEAPRRSVLFYPEAAYWVSLDVNVPLFLPIYAQRRVDDLHRIAQREAELGGRIDGQLLFDSGWEWGYWLNSVVAARAAWRPRLRSDSSVAESVSAALNPVVAPFGGAAERLRQLLLDIVEAQSKLLIHGEVNGRRPATVKKRNGLGYLKGVDTFAQLGVLINPALDVQPSRFELGSSELASSYWSDVDPLLDAMSAQFGDFTRRFEALASEVPLHSQSLLQELTDSMQITHLRAVQLRGLYRYSLLRGDPKQKDIARSEFDAAARALRAALVVVARREAAYRQGRERSAGWGDAAGGPTCYHFGYLWHVKDLYFWVRDAHRAVAAQSPCFMNVLDPIDEFFQWDGQTRVLSLVRALRSVLTHVPLISDLTDCLAPPYDEPHFAAPAVPSRSTGSVLSGVVELMATLLDGFL